jgi:twitching motility protein PilT
MAKIDVYLRSIERFGAAGAILTSGQAVTMRFPQGDRHATQVTPHDQLVALVREVAPAPALAQIDANRPARFEVDSNGHRYTLSVAAKPGSWQITIEPAAGSAAPAPAPAAAATPAPVAAPQPAPQPAAARTPRVATAPGGEAGDMAIERGQYDGGAAAAAAASGTAISSGSAVLDQLTAAARGARATDIYLSAGVSPMVRIGGELHPAGDRGPLDAETLSRELGAVAPAAARGAWTEGGTATFAYSDGGGRVRATLVRDLRGPGVALRLLPAEPIAIEQLRPPREVSGWLDQRGLVLVAGASGAGKTTTLATLVRALADKHRRIVAIEDPIEIVHAGNAWVSQRAVGVHMPDIAAGVAAAMSEGADVIAIGTALTAAAVTAVLDAVAAGHLVLVAVAAGAHGAVERLLAALPADRRDPARMLLGETLLGIVAPTLRGGQRSFEVATGKA